MSQPVIKPVANDFSETLNAIMPWNVLADEYGADLATKQLQLEHEAYTEGEKRFLKQLDRQTKAGEFADNAVAKPLLQTLVPKMVLALKEWKRVRLAATGPRPVAILKLHHDESCESMVISWDALAVITIKVVLSLLTQEDKSNLQQVVTRIGGNVEDEARYGRIREQEMSYFKQVVASNVAKRASGANKRAYMMAVEHGMQEEGTLKTTWAPWTTLEKTHVGIRLLEVLIESTGLVELVRPYAGVKDKDAEYVSLAPDYADLLSKRAGALAGVAPMYQPCVVPPRPWESIDEGGYWAAGRKPLNLIRTYSKKDRERYRHVYMPDVYDAVNIIQATPWKVNKKVLDVALEVVQWPECPVKGVPEQERNRPRELTLEEEENPELLKKWKRYAATVYRAEKARVSRRLGMEFTLAQADKFSQFKRIYFPYNMDWRGRVYAVPMFNPQGNDLSKGLLTLAQGAPIGEEGFYWLKIHGANTAGTRVSWSDLKTDKMTFPERIRWVEENHDNILKVAKDPTGFTWWAKMDSPFCFLAFCFEYAGVSHHGLSYNCSLPLAFDGSCSGIQHFSAMLRDSVGGAAVNLIPSEKAQDIYRIVADKVVEQLRVDVINGTLNEMETKENKRTGEITERIKYGTSVMAQQWLDYGVTRDVTKRSVMTLAYGSKEYGFRDQILEDTINKAIEEGNGTMFLDPNQAAGYMAKLVWDAVSVTVVAAVQAMKWLQSAAKLMAAEVKDKKTKAVLRPSQPIYWVTPDGYPVWQEYKKFETKRLNLLFLGSFNLQPTVRVGQTNEIDARKQEAGIAPNFVHSQDGSHLRMTVKHAHGAHGVKSFAVIHDSFGTIPAHAGKLFKAVRETMVKTYAENDVLADFYEQFRDQLHESQFDKMPSLPPKGDLKLEAILESDFAFA